MDRDRITADSVLGKQSDRTPIGVYLVAGYHEVAELIVARFAELRWQVIQLDVYPNKMPDHVKMAGALLTALPTDQIAQQFLDRGVPCVRLGRYPHPEDCRMPAVIVDHPAAGRLAAEHFAERGFRHVGFVGRYPWGMARTLYEGFRDQAEALGITCHLLSLDEVRLKSQVTPERTYMQVQKEHLVAWWRKVPKPLGILSAGAREANRFCQWVIDAGLRVPEDVAILSISDSILSCEGGRVPISSIDADDLRVAETGIDVLRDLIEGKQPEQCTMAIPPRGVITRQSTDMLAASDRRVVAALRYMWDHVTENLSVEQIAQHVGVSQRTLAYCFRRELGRGINAEFQRRRLEKARELLRRTDLEIGQIAEMLSFSSLSRLSRAFRETYGQSPAQYRQQSQT